MFELTDIDSIDFIPLPDFISNILENEEVFMLSNVFDEIEMIFVAELRSQ